MLSSFFFSPCKENNTFDHTRRFGHTTSSFHILLNQVLFVTLVGNFSEEILQEMWWNVVELKHQS